MQRLKEIYNQYDFGSVVVDENVKTEVSQILADHFAENDTPATLKYIKEHTDLTTLTVTDNWTSVEALVKKVNTMKEKVAAVCVYPSMVECVKETLTREGVGIAAVAGGFPASQTFIEVKVAETALAVAAGATEVDVVLSVGKFMDGNHSDVFDELTELKEAARGAKMKVILETGELGTAKSIKQAALLAMAAGADFIKTSTGKTAVGATPEAVCVMCHAAKEFYDKSGIQVGIKVAGGVRTAEDAIKYRTIVKEILGKEWEMRFGCSKLIED